MSNRIVAFSPRPVQVSTGFALPGRTALITQRRRSQVQTAYRLRSARLRRYRHAHAALRAHRFSNSANGYFKSYRPLPSPVPASHTEAPKKPISGGGPPTLPPIPAGRFQVWSGQDNPQGQFSFFNHPDQVFGNLHPGIGSYNPLQDAMTVGKDQSGNLFFAVADGIGACANAALASHTAMTVIGRYLAERKAPNSNQVRERLVDALKAAQEAVAKLIDAQTTVEIAYIVDDVVHFAGVGDSRGYVFEREGGQFKETTNTTVDTHASTIGDEELYRNHQLHSVVGNKDLFSTHYTSHLLKRGALVLLGTDGIWDNFTLKAKREDALQNIVSVDQAVNTLTYYALQQMGYLQQHSGLPFQDTRVNINGQEGVFPLVHTPHQVAIGRNGSIYRLQNEVAFPVDFYKADHMAIIGYLQP